MKKLFTFMLLVVSAYAKAQIGIGTTSPNSMLDVRGSFSIAVTSFSANTTAGASDNMFLFTGVTAATLTMPTAVGITGRIYWVKNVSTNSSTLTIATTSAQTIDGITTWPITQTNKAIRLISNGTNWYVAVESLPGNTSGTPWINGGNNVTSLQNIGTTSNFDFPFITNNSEKMRLTALGNLGIGTSTFNGTFPERLLVDAGTPGTAGNYQNVIVGKGNTNSYAQLNIQNSNAGTGASSDVVATADNGSETTNYVDMGINSSANTSAVMGGINDSYLYNIGQNFLIATGTAAKSLVFMTGGTTQSTNERMRIDGNGNVGIGTASPIAALHVVKSNSGGNVLTLQNTSASGFSSADFYSSSNVLSGTFGYGNGSASAPFTGRDYFNIYGNDFILSNGVASPFFVQGSTNNVGMNTTTPTEKLDVAGNIRFSGALMPGNAAGTSGNFLMSSGSGLTPTWIDPSAYLASLSWLQDGNNVASTKNLGTTSNFDLPIITNNTEQMRITKTGDVGIGTSTFSVANPEQLIVDAGTNASSAFQNVIVGKGNTNSYAQLNIQNTYSAAANSASSDVVATSDNGNESVNYIDMGINSGTNTTSGIYGSANTAYLYSTGNDFAFGNATASKNLLFFTGGTATGNERMRINGSGNVGIGTTSPTAVLHLKAGTSTASTAPLKLTAGTDLTTPEAGAIEFDGVNTYITNETTAGRGAIPVEQHFLLPTSGTAITTIGNYFGTTSNIPLVSGGYYEIDIYCYFAKTTASTVVWTFTNSAAPTSMDLHYDFSAIGGIVSTAAATSLVGDQYNLTTTAPTVTTGSLTTGVNHYAHFKIILLNGTGTSLKIQATSTAGSITPEIGSRWYCQRISTSNVGAFAN
jgi:hypothetical protein